MRYGLGILFEVDEREGGEVRFKHNPIITYSVFPNYARAKKRTSGFVVRLLLYLMSMLPLFLDLPQKKGLPEIP